MPQIRPLENVLRIQRVPKVRGGGGPDILSQSPPDYYGIYSTDITEATIEHA